MSAIGDSRYSHMGEIVWANQVITGRPSPRQARNTILLLAASVALMMTGFGIIMPVFPRRLAELGAGVQALGLMTMAFALAQLIASPIMGSLADRYGRRPLILLALFSFGLVNIGYLVAPTVAIFIAIRALGGVLTAGLFPAAMGMVGDLTAEEERGKWIGIVMAGYGAGFVLGPVIGGALYDLWGFAMPFIVSAFLAAAAFLAALVLAPETRPKAVRRRTGLRQRRDSAIRPEGGLMTTMPRPLTIFGMLLFLDFMTAFPFAFIEPPMVFHMYDELKWSTMQFGVVVGAYGLTMMLGQLFLGRTSDRYGRKLIILIGLGLTALLYAGIAFTESFGLILLSAALAGLGAALMAPALSAFYLDITAERYRARVLGVKGSALSLGGVLGPLAVVVASHFMSAEAIFITALVSIVVTTILAAVVLRNPQQLNVEPPSDAWEVANKRALAAEASLQGIVLNATARRSRRATR